MKNGWLKVEEVALLLDCSIYTINSWYRFKQANPDNEYAKMLPEFIRDGGKTKNRRLWNREDLPKLIAFKQAIPIGRKGVMGDITQKYIRNKRKQMKQEV